MNQTYTPDELAKLFKISKHTVYELIKRGELHAFKIGNKMRIEQSEVERFKNLGSSATNRQINLQNHSMTNSLHIAGSHDFLIEHLMKYVTSQSDILNMQPTYIGSLEGLMMLYHGKCDIAAIHLLDPSSGKYNIPFIKLFFVHEPLTVIRLASREQGLIIPKGNPKKIKDVHDLTRKEVTFVNRQKGAGTRFLLDSILAKENIKPSLIKGYGQEEWNHLATASHVSRGIADVTLGIKNAAEQFDLDFIPIASEQFDLVFRWTTTNETALQHLLDIIQLTAFKDSIQDLGGYGTEEFGQIMYEHRQ